MRPAYYNAIQALRNKYKMDLLNKFPVTPKKNVVISTRPKDNK